MTELFLYVVMKRAQILAVVAAALIVVGVLSFFLQPDPPDLECAPPGATQTSGFTIPEKGGCAASIESFRAFSEVNSSPKLFRIAGLVLVLGGVGVGVTSGVIALKQRKRAG